MGKNRRKTGPGKRGSGSQRGGRYDGVTEAGFSGDGRNMARLGKGHHYGPGLMAGVFGHEERVNTTLSAMDYYSPRTSGKYSSVPDADRMPPDWGTDGAGGP